MQARFKLTDIEQHPLRDRLNIAFHSRAPVPLNEPTLVSLLAFQHQLTDKPDEREHVLSLCQTSACRFIENSATHILVDAGNYQLRWELHTHTEFSSYTFSRPLVAGEQLDPDATAFDAVFPEWLSAIPGKLIVATHVEVRTAQDVSPESVLSGLSPTSGRQTVASRIAKGAAWAFTDFMFDNGFSRFLLIDESMSGLQPGRAVQRLLEIETYRILALLGLPVATEVGSWLNHAEARLANLMERIGKAATPEDERSILADLSNLAAEVESSVARTTFRFSASCAYHNLVLQRIDELREIRVPGYQMFHECMQRRFQPAMNTCAAMAKRQDDLSGRVARNSQLLRARRHRTRTPEPGTAGADEPACQTATAPAGNRRRFVDRRHHLLHLATGELPGEGRQPLVPGDFAGDRHGRLDSRHRRPRLLRHQAPAQVADRRGRVAIEKRRTNPRPRGRSIS